MRMTWFLHLKIANKIMLSVASMVALMVLLAAFGVARMASCTPWWARCRTSGSRA